MYIYIYIYIYIYQFTKISLYKNHVYPILQAPFVVSAHLQVHCAIIAIYNYKYKRCYI